MFFYQGNLFPINSIDEFMSRATRTGLLSNLQARAAAQADIFDLLAKKHVYEEFLIQNTKKNEPRNLSTITWILILNKN